MSSDGYTLEYICDFDSSLYSGWYTVPASVLDDTKYDRYFVLGSTSSLSGYLFPITLPEDYGYSSYIGIPMNMNTGSNNIVAYVENEKTNLGIRRAGGLQGLVASKLYGRLK